MKQKFWIELTYSDDSSFGFHVEIEGKASFIHAHLCMITRGTLMASMAKKATCYDLDGFDVCSYIK